MDNIELYREIETAIIRWSNDGTKTAGTLTREIIEIINKNKTDETVKQHFILRPRRSNLP